MQFKLAKFNSGPEIFYSIQGEGLHVGRPSIFIRTSLCNLNCTWCDTPYTWKWKEYDKKESIVEIEVDDVIQHLQQWPCKNLVFTGGEPMLQQPAFIELMQKLKPLGLQFEVETNATIPIEKEFDLLIDQYNSSPKLTSSGNEKEVCETKVFEEYVKNPKAWFKFVLLTPDDLQETQNLIQKYGIDPSRVFLMPEGKTKKELSEKSDWIVALAKKNGFCFSPRLHIELWGDRRGV